MRTGYFNEEIKEEDLDSPIWKYPNPQEICLSLDKIKNVLTKKTPSYLSRREPLNNSPNSIYTPLSPDSPQRKKLPLDMRVNFPKKSPI